MLLSLAFAQEKVTKEKSARLAPVRSLKKSNPRCGLNFLRSAPLPPPPRGEAVGWVEMKTTAEPSAVLDCCVVGIRRPNAGGRGKIQKYKRLFSRFALIFRGEYGIIYDELLSADEYVKKRNRVDL